MTWPNGSDSRETPPAVGDDAGAVDSLDDIDAVDESHAQDDSYAGVDDSADDEGSETDLDEDAESEEAGDDDSSVADEAPAASAVPPKPVGRGDCVVGDTDCLYSIAYEHGFYWKTLWELGENEELKQERKDPALLLDGDRVFIPPLRPKSVTGATGARHRIRLKGVPAKLRLRLLDHVAKDAPVPPPPPAPGGEELHVQMHDPVLDPQFEFKPRANAPYRLIIDAVSFEGTTDAQGILERAIAPNAREGTLIVDPGTPRQLLIQLRLGQLGPLTEISGVKQRLANLGFDCGDDSPQAHDAFAAAVAAFQESAGLPISGELDDSTRSAIQDAHGA